MRVDGEDRLSFLIAVVDRVEQNSTNNVLERRCFILSELGEQKRSII